MKTDRGWVHDDVGSLLFALARSSWLKTRPAFRQGALRPVATACRTFCSSVISTIWLHRSHTKPWPHGAPAQPAKIVCPSRSMNSSECAASSSIPESACCPAEPPNFACRFANLVRPAHTLANQPLGLLRCSNLRRACTSAADASHFSIRGVVTIPRVRTTVIRRRWFRCSVLPIPHNPFC